MYFWRVCDQTCWLDWGYKFKILWKNIPTMVARVMIWDEFNHFFICVEVDFIWGSCSCLDDPAVVIIQQNTFKIISIRSWTFSFALLGQMLDHACSGFPLWDGGWASFVNSSLATCLLRISIMKFSWWYLTKKIKS